MHVHDTKNKFFIIIGPPEMPPTITVKVCEDQKVKMSMDIKSKTKKVKTDNHLSYQDTVVLGAYSSG